MKNAVSFLYNKKLVFNVYNPLPFCIYEGMLESSYLISNSLAFSSVVSPGMYDLLRRYVAAIPAKKKLVVDDILGMCVPPKATDKKVHVKHVVWTTEFIRTLESLNRIVWRCPHTVADNKTLAEEIAIADAVICATPLHVLHDKRLDVINASVINANADKWFILPAGDNQHRKMAPLFYNAHVKREAYAMHIPAVVVDNGWVVIPPAHVIPPQYSGVIVERLPTIPGQSLINAWELENERELVKNFGA